MTALCITERGQLGCVSLSKGKRERKDSWSGESQEPGHVAFSSSSLPLPQSSPSHPGPTLWMSWWLLPWGEKLCNVSGCKTLLSDWQAMRRQCWWWMVLFGWLCNLTLSKVLLPQTFRLVDSLIQYRVQENPVYK